MNDNWATSDYLNRARDAARSVFERYPQHALDEQAGPAYLEGFALSRWIFWRRLVKVIGLLPAEGDRCLDFGCGFGLLLPLLERRFSTVFAVDLMPQLATEFLQTWSETSGENHQNISIFTDLQISGIEDGSLDLITALDVLEHVDALPELLEKMSRLLKPTGTLLVTGPTENWVYKLGRRLVGFSGDYHVRSIHDISREMKNHFSVKVVGRVFYPFTLFHILTGRPQSDI